MRLTAAAMAAACALAFFASSAGAKPRRLDGTKLTYRDSSTYPAAVKAAVALWNRAGTPVRLRATRSKSADIQFVTKASLVHQGHPVAGLGGIHFTKKGKPYGLVQLSAAVFGDDSEAERVDVTAHELGHAMGLPHSNVNCTLMHPANNFVRELCPSSSDTYLCGPQRADAAALAKLYRGKLRWPADGGLCKLEGGSAEFLEPAGSVTTQSGMVTAAVRNTGARPWTSDDTALTFTDAAGQRVDSPCGAPMTVQPLEPDTAPGVVAHFDLMLCATSGQTMTLHLRMLDMRSDTVFGPTHSFTVSSA